MGTRITRELRALGLIPALLGSSPAPAKVAKPYPLELAIPSPQDTHAFAQWYDPAKVAERGRQANEAHLLVAGKAWHDAKGNPGSAIETLVAESRNADGAQALLKVLRDLAVQGSERRAKEIRALDKETQKQTAYYEEELKKADNPEWKKELLIRKADFLEAMARKRPGTPAYPVPEGRPGITWVTQAAEALAARRKAGTTGPYDEILLPEVLRLIAYHGASEVPEAQKLATVDGKGKAAPVNHEVKAFLRRLLLSEPDLQPYASRALGQLGDLETARDIVANPRKYPGASISDFGPEAVALFKENRIAQLQKRGAGSEEAAFHSLRLTYQDRETAYDLAKAGDWGAGLAYERSLAMENLRSAEHPDDRFARYLDQYLRFPNTRQAEKAAWALTADSGLNYVFSNYFETDMPKTMEMLLRYFEYALRRTFVEQKPMDMEPVMEIEVLTIGFHYKICNQYRYIHYKSFFSALDALFRKYFPAGKKVNRKGMQYNSLNHEYANIYAAHVGLKAVTWEGKRSIQEVLKWEHERFYGKPWETNYPAKSPEEYLRENTIGINTSRAGYNVCIALGHFRLEDL